MWVTFNVREDFLKDFTVGNEISAFIPAFDKEIKFKVTYMKDLGTYAAWKATKTTGQFDLKTFEVKAVPVENRRIASGNECHHREITNNEQYCP